MHGIAQLLRRDLELFVPILDLVWFVNIDFARILRAFYCSIICHMFFLFPYCLA